MEIRRLLISRLGEGNIMLGNMIIKITIGSPIIVGVVKEVNRFSFILILRVLYMLVFWLILALDLGDVGGLKFLVGT